MVKVDLETFWSAFCNQIFSKPIISLLQEYGHEKRTSHSDLLSFHSWNVSAGKGDGLSEE